MHWLQRFFEWILGLQSGFLSREGQFTLQFNPSWPLQQYIGGAAVWNVLLGALALALVIYFYRREGRTRAARIFLGTLRALVFAFVLILLNRPVLTLGQERREPSILAIVIDDSISMKVRDAVGPDGKPHQRLQAVQDLLTGNEAELLKKLSAQHTVRIYDFSRGARQIATVNGPDKPAEKRSPTTTPADGSAEMAVQKIDDLKPDGDGTQSVSAVKTVLEDLQGQRVAAVVLLSDGRETPTVSQPDAVAAVKSFGVRICPVAVGSEKMPRDVTIESLGFESSAFVGDNTNINVTVRASGYEPNHPVKVKLEREITRGGEKVRVPVKDDLGKDVTATVNAPDERPVSADIQFKPTKDDMPAVSLYVEAEKDTSEVDDSNNVRKIQLSVLDENIAMLYVDGYPRWDYRYIRTSMLRDKTVKISCLLTSADPSFVQEGSEDLRRPTRTWAIKAFPNTMEQLLDYDVVIFGDVDPRQFTDAQLQMVSDFVSKNGGGFEMVAGPRWSPQAYRNTPIEAVLPVLIDRTSVETARASITAGFRPVLTKAGFDSTLFRFFPNRAENEQYIRTSLQEMFWYCRGVMVKPGVGITYAEHPSDLSADNRKTPIVVAGRFGAGRTLFSGIDESWRWRWYTGESIFNTYWVQQLRYLARSKKLGQRKITFTQDQEVYQIGKQVGLQVRVLSPDLMRQISPPLPAEIIDESTGQSIRRVELQRQEGTPDTYNGSFTADKAGQFTAKLPHLADQDLSVSFKVESPRLELADPRVDLPALRRLATQDKIDLSEAPKALSSIRSAAVTIPIEIPQPLWDAPLAVVIFAVLITLEWVMRKMYGLL